MRGLSMASVCALQSSQLITVARIAVPQDNFKGQVSFFISRIAATTLNFVLFSIYITRIVRRMYAIM
jgi:hypothetical protein